MMMNSIDDNIAIDNFINFTMNTCLYIYIYIYISITVIDLRLINITIYFNTFSVQIYG